MKCTTGKRGFETYGEASLGYAALDGTRDPNRGQIYSCPNCGAFHITKRLFDLRKGKGRGKRRKGVVYRDLREG